MCNLHWCYTFCTGVTLFALVLHLNCTALSQSESSNFFMYIISVCNHLPYISRIVSWRFTIPLLGEIERQLENAPLAAAISPYLISPTHPALA